MQNIGYDLSGLGHRFLRKTWLLQRTYNWQLIMPDNMRGVIGVLVSQFCQDVRFGDYSISEVSRMRYGPYQRSYAGLQSIDFITLTFLVPVDNSVIDYFYAWHELIVDRDGYYHPKNEYKKNIFVIMYDRTGIQSTKFTLKGVFPRTKPRFALSYGSESIATLSIELSIDCLEEQSFIGAIREGVTNLLGDLAGKAKGMFGKTGSGGTEWAGMNEGPGFASPTPTGTFYA